MAIIYKDRIQPICEPIVGSTVQRFNIWSTIYGILFQMKVFGPSSSRKFKYMNKI